MTFLERAVLFLENCRSQEIDYK